MEPIAAALQRMITQTLNEHSGNSTPTASEQYNCPECKDTGWIRFERDGYEFVEECPCRKSSRAKIRMENSGLKDVIHDYTFKSFHDEEPWQQAMLQKARKYVSVLKSGKQRNLPWFFIGGPAGCGKTHICTAICGQLLAAGKSVRYMRWLREAPEIKAAITDREEYNRLIARYTACDVLYIDDLFKSQNVEKPVPTPTEADVKLAFSILDERYVTDKPTVISSEWYLLDEIMATDEATFSRVYQRTGGGSDYNIRVAREPHRNWRITHADADTV